MPPRTGNARSHRSTLSLQKTEIVIHVYDLLPPGKIASVLWAVGAALLHSGVVINDKEYAYGGHDKPGVTGVYWTKPGTVPPGGTFRCEILHGFTLATDAEIEETIRTTSDEFTGPAHNLLTNNCNHFTSTLCKRLTGTPGPNWLNRAASIGVALPCLVPRDWIEPPEYDGADGELLGYEDSVGEESHMLQQTRPHFLSERRRSDESWDSQEERRRGGTGKGKQVPRHSAGRQ